MRWVLAAAIVPFALAAQADTVHPGVTGNDSGGRVKLLEGQLEDRGNFLKSVEKGLTERAAATKKSADAAVEALRKAGAAEEETWKRIKAVADRNAKIAKANLQAGP